MRYFIVLFITLSSYSLFAQFSMGMDGGGAISKSLPKKSSIALHSYEVGALLHKNINLRFDYTFDSKLSIGLTLSDVVMGYTNKVEQGFSPHQFFPMVERDTLPIRHYNKVVYNYWGMMNTFGYELFPKLKVYTGFQILKIRKKWKSVIHTDIFFIGTWAKPYNSFSITNKIQEPWYQNSWELSAHLGIQYFLWKGLYANLSFTRGIKPYRILNQLNSSLPSTKFYHQAFLGGVGYEYIFGKKRRKKTYVKRKTF